jgi:hypothetical protein
LNPAPFESDSIVSLKITMKEIHKRFDRTNDIEIINEWKLFSNKWLPLSECSVEYLEDLKRRRNLYKDASLWYILYVFCYFFLSNTNALIIFLRYSTPCAQILIHNSVEITNPEWRLSEPLKTNPITDPSFK